MIEKLISPVETILIENELSEINLIRYSRMGKNKIYILNADNGPNVLNEIGRLRELTYRQCGGGIGNSKDIDNFDLGEDSYMQLIIWDPIEKQILGGYRFRSFPKSKDISIKYFATGKLFDVSNKMLGFQQTKYKKCLALQGLIQVEVLRLSR